MESSEKSLESIANKITKNLIPALNKSAFELNTLVQDTKYLTLESKKLYVAPQNKAIEELKAIDAQVKILEENAKKYNYY